MKIFQFWQTIPWLKINWIDAPYPVLNERAIRTWAWIMFLLWIVAFFNALLIQNYFLIKIVVVIFFIDFFTKVIISPHFSIISIISNFLVKKQNPEYVWAIQKRFAWSLWLAMSSIMIILLFILNIKWPVNLTICLMCLTFMWLESSAWICVWCKIYYFLLNIWIISKPKHRPACPWWVCSLKS